PLSFSVLDSERDDAGASFRQALRGRLAARANRFVWGGRVAWGDEASDEFAPAGGGQRGALTEVSETDALAAELYAENQWHLTRRIALVAGLQLAYARREIDTLVGDGLDAQADYIGSNPKLGLIWQAAPAFQVFGNVSRSFEPPTLVEFGDATTGVLEEQTATTVEIGARGGRERLRWEMAAYHSRLDDEILTVELPPLPSNNFATANADDTRHSGIELGLDARVPLAWPAGDLRLRTNYTYSRFVFNNDPAFADNDIPGVPQHFGRLELLYEHPSGVYIGPNLAASGSYFVDFTNTLETEVYTIYGLRAGYANERGFSVFVEARNLEDEAYASNTSLTADAMGMDTAVFNPGLERSVYAGVDIGW
ncbi:MAG: TonB-dependent receptor domain-containing protein, partial [Gammaproteobacteria bacterium]